MNATHLDDDLLPQLAGRGQLVSTGLRGLHQQHVAKHLLEHPGHVALLLHTTVLLDGQDHGEAAGAGAGQRARHSLHLCFPGRGARPLSKGVRQHGTATGFPSIRLLQAPAPGSDLCPWPAGGANG